MYCALFCDANDRVIVEKADYYIKLEAQFGNPDVVFGKSSEKLLGLFLIFLPNEKIARARQRL